MFSTGCTERGADWNVRRSLLTLRCWLLFIWLLSLWKVLCIVANRRCIYPCLLQGCQLHVQPGKRNAGSALPALPPSRPHRRRSPANKPKFFLSFLWYSRGSVSCWHISCQVAKPALAAPGTRGGQSACACAWLGGFFISFKDGLQWRNRKCRGQGLSVSLLTRNFRGGKRNGINRF